MQIWGDKHKLNFTCKITLFYLSDFARTERLKKLD